MSANLLYSVEATDNSPGWQIALVRNGGLVTIENLRGISRLQLRIMYACLEESMRTVDQALTEKTDSAFPGYPPVGAPVMPEESPDGWT